MDPTNEQQNGMAQDVADQAREKASEVTLRASVLKWRIGWPCSASQRRTVPS